MKTSLFFTFLTVTLASNSWAAGGEEYDRIYDRTIEGKSLEQYFQAINGGWVNNLVPLRKALRKDRNYIVIHAQEPKSTMDLRTADHFRQSTLAGGILSLTNDSLGIGHTFVSWRCQTENGPVEGTVGMTGENDTQFKKMTDAGYGLSAFLAVWFDGHLQTPELMSLLWKEEKPVHSVAIEVSPEVCHNAARFVKKFLFHPDRPFETFGFIPDSEKFEGGGCGSFAVGVINQSGVFGRHPVTKGFWRNLRGNSDLFGWGLPHPEDADPWNFGYKGTRSVSLVKMFTSNWNGNGPNMRIMDPEMILLFFRTLYRATLDEVYAESAARGRHILNNKKLYPYRKYPSQELAQEIVIDSKFDPQAKAVVKSTKSWLNDLRSKGYKARSTFMGPSYKPAFTLILDR